MVTYQRSHKPMESSGTKAASRFADNPGIEGFLHHCHFRHYPSRAVIIQAGEPSKDLYYLVSGSVSVQMEGEAGREIVLAYLNQGDFFGEIGMFDEKRTRSAWVRARIPCEVAQISYSHLQELAASYPEVLFALLSQVALRLRDTSRRLGDLTFMDASGRVARVLLDLGKQPDAMTHPEGVQIRVTRMELGRLAGCSREVVGRVLKNLQEQHLISVQGKTIVLHGCRGGREASAGFRGR